MSCTRTMSKICLTGVGLLFWLAAASLIFLGAWVFHTYNHFNELMTANLTLIPAGILISVGVFLFILGGVGCIAACKENKCLLAVFFSLLLIVLTAEVTAAVLGYLFRTQIKTTVDTGLKSALDKYNSSSLTSTDQIDYLQAQGCSSLLEQKFQNNLVYTTGVAVVFAVIQFFGMICSCVLMCRSQEVKYEILGGPNSGVRM